MRTKIASILIILIAFACSSKNGESSLQIEQVASDTTAENDTLPDLSDLSDDSLLTVLHFDTAKLSRIVSLSREEQTFLNTEGNCSEGILVTLQWVNITDEEFVDFFWIT